MDYFDILLAKKLSGGGGGGEITVEGLTVNDNGTYTAPSGKAYSPVVVNLPLGEKAITANGEYNASADDLKGYSKVTVNVEGFKVKDMPTGAISSFDDGTENPLKELKVSIVPVQSGSGDPSPSNPRPISGWDEVNVTRCGKNLFDKANCGVYNGYIKGNQLYGSESHRTIYIPCKPNTTYSSANFSGNNRKSISYSSELPSLGLIVPAPQDTITTDANAKYLLWYCFNANSDSVSFDDVKNALDIELGSVVPTTYHAYNGTTTTIPLGQTVYGGELDVTSGMGIKTHVKVDLGTLNWSKNTETETYQDWRSNSIASLIKAIPTTETPIAWCEEYEVIRRASQTSPYTIGVTSAGNLVIYTNPNEYASGDDLKTALNGVNFVYELATPTDFTFNSTSVKSLLGTNNLWADSGEVLEGEYFISL